MSPSPRSTRLRPALVAGALVSGLVVGPVAVPLVVAAPASAAPCTVILGIPICGAPEAAAPTISGDRRTGGTVTVSTPAWDQDGVTTTYQWLRNGEAIDGATAQSYMLTQADFGEDIKARATGDGQGISNGTVDSEFFSPAKGAAPVPTRAPDISGDPKVGSTLTLDPGAWGEPTPDFKYQWYRNNGSGKAEAIPGATTATYVVTSTDQGRRIVAAVVADRVGYEPGTALSDVVQVGKVSTTVAASFLRSTVKRNTPPTLQVAVRGVVGSAPTGVLTVFEGTRRVRSVQLAASSKGVVAFRLPLQKVGNHRYVVRYAGDAAHLPSVSPAARLRVVK